MTERLVGGDPQQPWPQGSFVAETAPVIQCREQPVRDHVFRDRSIPHDEVGDRLHVTAVPGEHVGQHLGASPAQCLDRHPTLSVAQPPWWPAGGSGDTG